MDSKLKLNFSTNKLITFCYPPGAGGKFLMNCLALSRHAVFQDQSLVYKEFYLENKHKEIFYNFKFASAMKSLPVKSELKNWMYYEYDIDLFNWEASDSWHKKLTNNSVSNEVKILSNHNKNFFLVAHDVEKLKKIINYFPNTKILLIKNFLDFMLLCNTLKFSPPMPRKGKIWWKNYGYKEFINSFSNYKIDYTVNYEYIFDEEKFLYQIENLYNQLGYDDFNKNMVTKFYRAYIELHK